MQKDQFVADKLMQADIAMANSELLLFITLFGDTKLKVMAKTELSRRTCCQSEEIECFTDHDLSIVAKC